MHKGFNFFKSKEIIWRKELAHLLWLLALGFFFFYQILSQAYASISQYDEFQDVHFRDGQK